MLEVPVLDGFMDEGFADVWTPVALSREVGAKPLPVTLASERLVLFRGADGQVGALRDRCPHRGVALSLGKVGKDGCLACPFHGWRFAADGACTDVPLSPLPPEKRQHLAAMALPVRERGGFIWVYTRPGTEAPEEPTVSPALVDARFRVWRYAKTWRTHWTRAMENMLDAPHLPFVHRRTIGRGLRARMKPDSRMEVHTQPTPTGMRVTWELDGTPSAGHLEWARPNGMVLDIPMGGGRRSVMHVWCVPVDARTTRMVLAVARNFGHYNPLGSVFDAFSKLILLEDQAVVESSDPAEVPPASEEKSVATDRATLAFRRWYQGRVRGSAAGITPSPSLAG